MQGKIDASTGKVSGTPVSGNPVSYYNGTRWSFEWEQGRRLVEATSAGTDVEYTYDMDGIRTSKTVNGTTYNYITQNGKVVRQTWTKNGSEYVTDFFYDNNGNPTSFCRNGKMYYYILNLQGDVIRIVDSTGLSYGIYQYDAWGNIIYSTNDDVVNDNPLRYRGYYYDTETGFYYLQSRYYDPSIGRFINADSYASTGQGFIGYNMFVYCLNNPTIYADNNGEDAILLIDSNSFGHLGALVQDAEGDWWHFYYGGQYLVQGKWWAHLYYAAGLSDSGYSSCDIYTEPTDLVNINAHTNYGGTYTDMQLMEGDFSSCVDTMKTYNESYSLYSNNCSQATLKILSSADTNYRSILSISSEIVMPYRAFQVTKLFLSAANIFAERSKT